MRREEILVQKRIEKGLSVAELAEILGVSARKIEKWEAGELPEAKYLLILSSTLDIPVELILQGGVGENRRGSRQANGLPFGKPYCKSELVRSLTDKS